MMWKRIKAGLDVLSTVVVAVAAVALLWRLFQPAPLPPGSRPRIEAVDGLVLKSDRVSNTRGRGDIVLVEFADYECPFCARHTQTTAPAIQKELIDTGKIRHAFLNFPLSIHAKAQKAGEAAECAARQGRFWEMHERLFEDTKSLDMADFARHAESLPLDRARFMQCLENGETADKVKADLAEGERLGISGTPAFFVGVLQPDGAIKLVTRINGSVEFEEFRDAIRDVETKHSGRQARS